MQLIRIGCNNDIGRKFGHLIVVLKKNSARFQLLKSQPKITSMGDIIDSFSGPITLRCQIHESTRLVVAIFSS